MQRRHPYARGKVMEIAVLNKSPGKKLSDHPNQKTLGGDGRSNLFMFSARSFHSIPSLTKGSHQRARIGKSIYNLEHPFILRQAQYERR
jgi:hypothetical protein